jgi:hypothetical protein
LLCGCNGARELEEREYVLGLGISLDSGDNYIVYAEYEDVDSGERNVIYDSGKTIAQAVEALNMRTARELYLGHNSVIILSNRLVRDSEQIGEVIGYARSERELNLNTAVLCSDNVSLLFDKEYTDKSVVDYVKSCYSNGNEAVLIKNIMAGLNNKRAVELPDIELAEESFIIDGTTTVDENSLL